jgi:DNA (cytosine-5)-methyltransferase 1
MDLFAGCGGMTRGFVETARFEPVFAVEMDEHAARTYAANFGEDHVRAVKIEAVDWFPEADVVIGGPPCQGFSPLNRNGIGLERRALWREYLRALRESSPEAFVMENVPELLRSAEYDAFRAAAQDELGYTVEGRVLNAANFGVPQRRRRAIVIGIRAGEVPWPQSTHCDPEAMELGLEQWRTFADAVRGLPRKPTGKNWHNGRNPRPETIVRYQHVPHDGGNRFQMQDNLDAAGLGHLVPHCWRNVLPLILRVSRIVHRCSIQLGDGRSYEARRDILRVMGRGGTLREWRTRSRSIGRTSARSRFCSRISGWQSRRSSANKRRR